MTDRMVGAKPADCIIYPRPRVGGVGEAQTGGFACAEQHMMGMQLWVKYNMHSEQEYLAWACEIQALTRDDNVGRELAAPSLVLPKRET